MCCHNALERSSSISLLIVVCFQFRAVCHWQLHLSRLLLVNQKVYYIHIRVHRASQTTCFGLELAGVTSTRIKVSFEHALELRRLPLIIEGVLTKIRRNVSSDSMGRSHAFALKNAFLSGRFPSSASSSGSSLSWHRRALHVAAQHFCQMLVLLL